MSPLAISVLAVAVALFLVVEFKTSRPDGELIPMPPFRRIMQFLMPTRTESAVYFDAWVDAENLLAYHAKVKDSLGAGLTHITVAAAGMALSATPRMNRFVMGGRLYARKGKWLTFSMKRKKLDREAKLGTVKLEFLDGESFADWCVRVNGGIGEERSGKRTAGDKELDLFNLLPRHGLRAAAWLINTMNYYNVLPGEFIRTDPMHCSIFVANLGSLDMDPGYHHLFEYGNAPLFIMVGRIKLEPTVVGGQVVARRRIHVRFSYDERIDDGLNTRFGIEAIRTVLADPERFLGCVAADASDRKPMWPRPEGEAELHTMSPKPEG